MEIKILNCRSSKHNTIKGNFDLYFPEIKLTIKECRLVKRSGSNGEYFIGFPSSKTSEGQWINHAFMENGEWYDYIIAEAVKGALEHERQSNAS